MVKAVVWSLASAVLLIGTYEVLSAWGNPVYWVLKNVRP